MTTTVLTKQQVKTETAFYSEGGHDYRITATIRYDDQCGNGHNTFSITGSIDEKRGSLSSPPRTCRSKLRTLAAFSDKEWRDYSGGCIHEDIARHFPRLAPYIKWHLTSSDEPTHYVANAIYLAGDRDCHGLRAGETRQIRNGKTGLLAWKLTAASEGMEKYIDAAVQPAGTVTHSYQPLSRTGEGKERQLDAARRVAVWPEATDAELMQEPAALRAVLLARLPGLMADFRAAVESLGFTY